MSYVKIDHPLEKWSDYNKVKLLEEEGSRRRYFYVSSSLAETFQVVIEPEKDTMVRVDAHLIESKCDEPAHFIWTIPVGRIADVLDICMLTAQRWFDRRQ